MAWTQDGDKPVTVPRNQYPSSSDMGSCEGATMCKADLAETTVWLVTQGRVSPMCPHCLTGSPFILQINLLQDPFGGFVLKINSKSTGVFFP